MTRQVADPKARPVSIGLVIRSRTSGGGAVFRERLTASLQGHPQCARLVWLVDDVDATGAAEADAVALGKTAAGRWSQTTSWFAARSISSALDRHPVDALVFPGTQAIRVPGVVSVMWPLTVAPYEPEAVDQLASSLLSRVRWALLQRTIGRSALRADALVFSSHYARTLYAAKIRGLASKPTSVLTPAPSLSEVPKRPWECPPGRSYVLFVSHLYRYKMVVEMIEGFATAVRDAGFPHDLLVVGAPVDAAYASDIRACLRSLGIQHRVRLLGPVSQDRLADLYRKAWAFVFPSISENAGSYALLDAFAMGVPVLTSDHSSMPEVSQGGAQYFNPRQPQELARLLRDWSDSPERHRRQATLSADRGRELHTWHDIADGLVRFVQQLTAADSDKKRR